MNDLISRQEAIDETWKEPSYTDPYNVLTEVRGRIQSLPSAQPEKCEDAVSREEAKWVVFCHRDHVEDQANAIDELPSVRPSAQPRNGEWIDYSDEGYIECPFCHSATNCEGNKDELHYCFSCGAELR